MLAIRTEIGGSLMVIACLVGNRQDSLEGKKEIVKNNEMGIREG